MPFLIGLLAVVAGVLNTVQSGANATLNKTLAQPITAALVVAATNVAVCSEGLRSVLASQPYGFGGGSGLPVRPRPYGACLSGRAGAGGTGGRVNFGCGGSGRRRARSA